MLNLTDFGAKVKLKLLKKGISQRNFCHRYKIPYKYFTEILNGRKAKLRSKYIQIITKALRLD